MTVWVQGENDNVSNLHHSYGTYEVTGLTDLELVITFIDSDGCREFSVLTLCDTCPEGYEPTDDGRCVGYDIQDANYSATTFTIVKKVANSAYSVDGMLIFDSWNYNGTGTFEWLNNTNSYWRNVPFPSSVGVMNRTAVWASTTYAQQDVGFSFCIEIGATKSYYIGFGCDNYGKIKINGTLILEQNVNALKAMYPPLGMPGGNDNGVPFKYWYVYPVQLESGRNVIEVLGYNSESVAGIGIEIYDATKQDLMTATSDADLAGKILFRSSNLVGNPLHYEYSVANGFHGYYCNEGYALNTCGETIFCEKREIIDCEEPSLEGCVEYGLIYNHFAVIDERNIANEGWLAMSEDDWIELYNVIPGVDEIEKSRAMCDNNILYWNQLNGSTNSSGMSVRGGTYRESGTGIFGNLTFGITYVTTTPTFTTFCRVVYISAGQQFQPSGFDAPTIGGYVRLLKNTTTLSNGETGTYTGNDGHIYKTICINGKEYLTENLMETQYRNGDPIPFVEDNTEWAALTTGAVCAYNNDYTLVGCNFVKPS